MPVDGHVEKVWMSLLFQGPECELGLYFGALSFKTVYEPVVLSFRAVATDLLLLLETSSFFFGSSGTGCFDNQSSFALVLTLNIHIPVKSLRRSPDWSGSIAISFNFLPSHVVAIFERSSLRNG